MVIEALKRRLIEAAKAAEDIPAMRIEIVSDGVRTAYGWLNSRGFYNVVENHTPWQQVEENESNPLLAAMTSLTKEAGGMQ